VLAEHVVADLGSSHRFAHRRGGLGDRVAAEVEAQRALKVAGRGDRMCDCHGCARSVRRRPMANAAALPPRAAHNPGAPVVAIETSLAPTQIIRVGWLLRLPYPMRNALGRWRSLLSMI